MPIFFGVVSILFIVAGVRGQSKTLFTLIKSDFSGQPNYFEWMVAIILVGAIGYVKELSTISRMFMVIILVGLLYKNKQVFQDFTAQETATPQTPQQTLANAFTLGQTDTEIGAPTVVTGLTPLPSLQTLTSNLQ